jgi:hypothetical protein
MAKKIHVIKTLVSGQDEANVEVLSMLQEFDINGNLILTNEFDEDGNVVYESRQQFDDRNRIIFSKIISEEDDYGEKKNYSYSESGQLEKERIEYDGGWFSVRNYEYDPETKSSKMTCVDEDNELEEMIIIEYNEKKLPISHKEYDEYSKLKLMVKTAYNDDDTIAVKEEYDQKGKLEKTTKYFYNDDGKLLGLKVLNRKEKLLDWVKIEYNENGQPIEQLFMSGAKIQIEYNPDNNSSTELYLNSNGEISNKTTFIRDFEDRIIEEQTNDKITKYIYEYYD